MSIPEFKLDAFEGPLDLLLHLIAKHKLNIYDIEISLLLDQYLEYIEGLEEQDFDAAGDFLAMAARLVYIKTCSLLPQPEEAEEMKKELQGELLDYSECKAAAARLLRLSVYGDVFVRPPEKLPVNKVFTGTISPDKLVEAYLGMNAKTRNLKPVRAEQFSPLVRSRFVTVTSKIIHVLKRLLKTGECTVAELYVGVEDKSSRVATFLAVLELAKSGRISLNDDNTVISFNRSAPRRHDPNAKPAETKPKEQYTVPTVTIERAVPKEQYTVPTVTIERAA
ncbi:condensin subunit ScpA, partial [Ruminococcus sp. YE71]|uniref:segregation and condensation protein A n=2 Tax=unclassified Ruminococcus TaxID=2608920 RepID=UPI000908900E